MNTINKDFNNAINIIKKISIDVLSQFADICDKENRFPIESFSAIKENNLQALMVPEYYGGWGLNFLQYQQCLTIMGQHCAATASAFNMHNIVVGSVANSQQNGFPKDVQDKIEKRFDDFYRRVVVDKAIFAAATTEPGIGARFSEVKTHYERIADGYILMGKKSFVTMASYADYYLVLANKKLKQDEVPNKHLISYFMVPRSKKGVSINETWDVMGMRATGSHEVIFDQVELSKDAVFMGQEGFALARIMREPHWVTGGYVGVYLGLMEAIYRFTLEYIIERSDYAKQQGLAFNTLIQARIGEMFNLLNTARLTVYSAAEKVDKDPKSLSTHQAVYAAKYYVGESVPQLASLAFRTCGGGSIHKKFNLERLSRDAQCGRLMPAVSDMCQLFIGKTELDIEQIEIW